MADRAFLEDLAMGYNFTDTTSLQKEQDEFSDMLPKNFVPGKWDVICQRGKECFDHSEYLML